MRRADRARPLCEAIFYVSILDWVKLLALFGYDFLKTVLKVWLHIIVNEFIRN